MSKYSGIFFSKFVSFSQYLKFDKDYHVLKDFSPLNKKSCKSRVVLNFDEHIVNSMDFYLMHELRMILQYILITQFVPVTFAHCANKIASKFVKTTRASKVDVMGS